MSLRTTSDIHRDQVIRYLDLAAYHYLSSPEGDNDEFYFILITDVDEAPWILSRYRSTGNIVRGLTDFGFFGSNKNEIGKLLSNSVGWTSWGRLREILNANREKFKTNAEKRFVDDLVLYLDYKIREAERIRNERKQLSFW